MASSAVFAWYYFSPSHEILQVFSPAKGGELLNISICNPGSRAVIYSPSQSWNFQILLIPSSESSFAPPLANMGIVQV